MGLRKQISAKFVAVFVSVILLANLLLPSIAAASVNRDQFSQLFNVICTASGLKRLDASSDQSVPSHNQQGAVHCPMCAISGSPALPSLPLSFVALFQDRLAFESASVYKAPLRVFWFSTTPRGPPVLA
jgi:hypothetical protein